MNENILCLLQNKGIELEKGLSCKEILKIENIYNLKFPLELKCLFQYALPTQKGFYNWKDFSEKNIKHIMEMINRPQKCLYEMTEEIYWCEDWGEEPKNKEKRIEIIRKKIRNAPKLVPVFAHRYIPICDISETPVLSIHGTDVIYYGKNLEDYFQIEFGDKKQHLIDFQKIAYIPFWSDIM